MDIKVSRNYAAYQKAVSNATVSYTHLDVYKRQDPKDEGRNGEPGSREGGHVHVLITFDVPGVGQMEAEFMMAGKELGFHLYCPESYIGIFESLVPEFRNIMEEHGYKASGIEVERMDHVRSLMEVFKNLPFKRTGVDVKI